MSLYDWSYAYESIPGISRAPRGKLVGYPYQEAAVQQIVNVRSHTYCGHHPGCIGGDEIIKVMRHGKVFPIKMRDLYRKFNERPGRDPWTKPGKCSTKSLFPNGELRHNEILKVVNSGEKATVIVTLASGKTLQCTPDHEIHTPKGWVRADNIETGSVVHTNGVTVCVVCGKRKPVYVFNRAKFRGWCSDCRYSAQAARQVKPESVDKDGHRTVRMPEHHRANKDGRVYQHDIIAETTIGRPLLDCESVHHKDFDKGNNSPDNLKVMLATDHLKLHGSISIRKNFHGCKGGKGGDIVFYPRDDSVVSVVSAGVTDTYDIVMAEPARSFVASGVIVHNSGKTPIALLTSLAYTLSDPILVVCPPSIVYQWADRALEWTGVHWSTATTTDQVRTLLRQPSATIPARFIVPDTLIHEIPWCPEHFALLVIDECFVAGTKIDSIYGQVPIEHVRPGMIVRNASGFGVVRRVMKKVTNRLTKVEWETGKCVCTDNHPFLTDRGWTLASELTPAHRLYNLHHVKMLMVQGPSDGVANKGKGSFLRNVLFSEVENETPSVEMGRGNEVEKLEVVKVGVSAKPGILKAIVGSNVESQPDAHARCSRTDVENVTPNRTSSEGEGWEWDWPIGVREAGMGYVSRIGMESRDQNGNAIPDSASLQNRHRVADSENSIGDRRIVAHVDESKVCGSTEGIGPLGVRVVRVQSFQCSSQERPCSGDVEVYNLEVSGHPSYFANGVLVHNCHRFKARDARRTKAVFGYGVQQGLRQRSDKVLALSGTPMPNNPTELYPYLHACHASLAPNFAQFAARYCPPESQWINTKRGRQEILVYKKATNGAELGRLLRETCLIRPKRENILSQLPELRVDRFQLKIGVKSKRSVAEVLAAWKSRDPKADVALATERKDVGSMKATASLDWLETLLEAGESPVIFTWHKEAAEILGSKLGVPVIHGGRSPEERMADIAKFARGEAKAIVGTIGSCGTGIDGLQHRTDLMIFIERSYVPADMDQAYGRIWRIGQKVKVRVVIVEADHAIDHAIEQSLSRKSDDIATIVG